MKVYDSVNKTEVEVDGTQGLIDIMVSGRQVDFKPEEAEKIELS